MRQANCGRCGLFRWVNAVTVRGDKAGEFCGDCFDLIEHDDPERHKWAAGDGGGDPSPWQENAIRAMEDR